MTDKILDRPLQIIAMNAFSKKVILACSLITSFLVQPTHAAEQEWWFDVEVILFKRNVDASSISEKFKQSQIKQPNSGYVDVLTPNIKPDLSYLRAGLPYCRASNRLKVQSQYEQDFAFPLPVAETNEPLSSQSGEQQTKSNSVVSSGEISEESFQYEVATSDIFTQSGETKALNSADLEKYNADNLHQAESADLVNQFSSTTQSIQVKFIEWQPPSEYLCSYAEQIDPSFASMAYVQNNIDSQASNQIKQTPVIIEGKEWQTKHSAFLLPASTMHMGDLYEKIKRQSDITPILHINWRQEVKFGPDKGEIVRLFAGKNFADQFDTNGLPLLNGTAGLIPSVKDVYIPEEEQQALTPNQLQALVAKINGTKTDVVTEDLFTRIDAALADDTPVNINQASNPTEQLAEIDSARLNELWQIDGGMKVYLRNVGSVPYLHVDSNLDFRQPVYDHEKALKMKNLSTDLSEQEAIVVNQLQQAGSLQPNLSQPNSSQPNYLQSVNFNQLRRVISKQVHYFDHPLFGMIVRINRYKWPTIEEASP